MRVVLLDAVWADTVGELMALRGYDRLGHVYPLLFYLDPVTPGALLDEDGLRLHSRYSL